MRLGGTTMTALKVDDRVRCTLGESVVVVGVVTYYWGDGFCMRPDGCSTTFYVVIADGWTVEILPPPTPPLPEIEGTVVLDADGFAWQRRGAYWWYREVRRSTFFLHENGPLTVLHVPEVT